MTLLVYGLRDIPMDFKMYTAGKATKHSDTIIDASGVATEHSEEGKPARSLIIEIASGEGFG